MEIISLRTDFSVLDKINSGIYDSTANLILHFICSEQCGCRTELIWCAVVTALPTEMHVINVIVTKSPCTTNYYSRWKVHGNVIDADIVLYKFRCSLHKVKLVFLLPRSGVIHALRLQSFTSFACNIWALFCPPWCRINHQSSHTFLALLKRRCGCLSIQVHQLSGTHAIIQTNCFMIQTSYMQAVSSRFNNANNCQTITENTQFTEN